MKNWVPYHQFAPLEIAWKLKFRRAQASPTDCPAAPLLLLRENGGEEGDEASSWWMWRRRLEVGSWWWSALLLLLLDGAEEKESREEKEGKMRGEEEENAPGEEGKRGGHMLLTWPFLIDKYQLWSPKFHGLNSFSFFFIYIYNKS